MPDLLLPIAKGLAGVPGLAPIFNPLIALREDEKAAKANETILARISAGEDISRQALADILAELVAVRHDSQLIHEQIIAGFHTVISLVQDNRSLLDIAVSAEQSAIAMSALEEPIKTMIDNNKPLLAERGLVTTESLLNELKDRFGDNVGLLMAVAKAAGFPKARVPKNLIPTEAYFTFLEAFENLQTSTQARIARAVAGEAPKSDVLSTWAGVLEADNTADTAHRQPRSVETQQPSSEVGSNRATGDARSIPCDPEGAPSRLFDVSPDRSALYRPLVKFVVQRDIVFAFGGVGSDLSGFGVDFADHLESNGVRQYSKIDLRIEEFEAIRQQRMRQIDAMDPGSAKYHASMYRDVKCLFAALAHAACDVLHNEYPAEIERLIDAAYIDNPTDFAWWYFSLAPHASDTAGADSARIVRYFFATLQRFAEQTAVEGVLVFMPLEKFAKWFRGGTDSTPDELWKALQQATVTRHRPPEDGLPVVDTRLEIMRSEYDKVCLVVLTDRAPLGHKDSTRTLLSRTVWPIPPLTRDEIAGQLGRISSRLAASREAIDAVSAATGGSPWFVRLLLTWIDHTERSVARQQQLSVASVVRASVSSAKEALVSPNSCQVDIAREIREHRQEVETALEGPDNTVDGQIREAWAGSESTRRRGVRIDSERIEQWLSSGLVWLDGDPWDPTSESYVFRRYDRVCFRRAAWLPLVVADAILGWNDVEE